MTGDDENIEQYGDLLGGLERLAQSLDVQVVPVSVDTASCKRVARPGVFSFRRPIAWASLAAAAAIVAGVLWLWPQHDANTVVKPLGTLVSAPAGNTPGSAVAKSASAVDESTPVSLQVPSFSFPSFSDQGQVSVPAAADDKLTIPSMPQSGAAQVQFQVPSISFPAFTERSSNHET